jgi:hypothetical protein
VGCACFPVSHLTFHFPLLDVVEGGFGQLHHSSSARPSQRTHCSRFWLFPSCFASLLAVDIAFQPNVWWTRAKGFPLASSWFAAHFGWLFRVLVHCFVTLRLATLSLFGFTSLFSLCFSFIFLQALS